MCIICFTASPLILCTLLDTEEKSLNNEFQGGATIAGFKFTWGRVFTQAPGAIFLQPFPWKPHTVAAAALSTPQKRGSYFSLAAPPLGGVPPPGSRASWNERLLCPDLGGCLVVAKINARKGTEQEKDTGVCGVPLSMDSQTTLHIKSQRQVRGTSGQRRHRSNPPIQIQSRSSTRSGLLGTVLQHQETEKVTNLPSLTLKASH